MNIIRKYFQYVSDLHLEKGFKRNINARKPYLILGGDIGYSHQQSYKDFLLEVSTSFDKVFIISGNHEYDKTNISETEDKIRNICDMRNNLLYLQKDTHKIYKNIYIAGCTFWSILPKSKKNNHLEHVNWLTNTLKSNPQNNYIVATHHCPLYECLNIKYDKTNPNYFASDQTDIIKLQNMLVWIYGHSHIHKDINVYGKWLISNQYGSYPEPLYGFKN